MIAQPRATGRFRVYVATPCRVYEVTVEHECSRAGAARRALAAVGRPDAQVAQIERLY